MGFKKRFARFVIGCLMIAVTIPGCSNQSEKNHVQQTNEQTVRQEEAKKPEGKRIEGKELADIVGVTHADGKYNFSGADYLNEGADQLIELGTRVIKVWFTRQYSEVYPFNTEWPLVESMTDLAQTDYFQKLFDKPFTTYILEAHGFANVAWNDGMTPDEMDVVKDEMYQLTKYFLTKYKNSGKTFVLQNWEGDNMIGQGAVSEAIEGMIAWFNARQDGIDQARKEVGMNGVKVIGAAEVNKISSSWAGPKIIDVVIPNTHCDLYSYSNWETEANAKQLIQNLDYIAEKAPDSELYGSKNVFLGEFGAGERLAGGEAAQLKQTQVQLETALDWGIQYAVYWELYCNQRKPGLKSLERPKNVDLSGFWLIRPDGTKSRVWDYLKELYKTNLYATAID